MFPPSFPPFFQAAPIPGYPRFRISRDGKVWTWGWRGKWQLLRPYTNSEGKKCVWMNDPYSEKPVGAASSSMMATIEDLLSKTYG